MAYQALYVRPKGWSRVSWLFVRQPLSHPSLPGGLLGGLLLLLSGCADMQPLRAVRIASASTSHALCSGVFVSGRDPDAVYQQELRPEAGMGLLNWALRYDVDERQQQVTTRIAGMFEERAAFLPGYGCMALHGGALVNARKPPDLDVAGAPDGMAPSAAVSAWDPRVRAAIVTAFAESAGGPLRNTAAIVVVHRGQIIAERYAPGIGLHTPLHGHSVSKTVTQALVGVLRQQDRLPALDVRAPVPEWAGAGDDRRNVSMDQLLRMTSGLPRDEYAGGFDAASRMWHFERDMFAFAVQGELDAPPRNRWRYSNLGFMVLSRLIRDAVGGSASAVRTFAQRELFAPLGMQDALIEFDATGTPIGPSHVYASARDWARFGLFYLNDGVVNGRRILPPGWVRAATTASPGTGYGAAFWLNNTQAANPKASRWGMPGAPADAYFARGYLGQYLVIVPSAELVVVRLAATHIRPENDVQAVGALVGDVVKALASPTVRTP